MKRRYFDHNATTPVAREVADAMTEELRACYGNASSVHQEGQAARRKLEAARREVAAAISASVREIVFTSGGTEANNLAIFGTVRRHPSQPRHVITSAVEHPSVLEACRQLEREGVAVTYLPVDRNGWINPRDVAASLRDDTCLVSVMHANNEIGTIEPVAEIASVVRATKTPERDLLFHSDGVQALGRLPIDVQALGVDLYSLSAHKVSGPRGTGALYVRKGVLLEPLHRGGRQERAQRPGTENVPSICGFATALELLHRGDHPDPIETLRDAFEAMLAASLDGVAFNGDGSARLPNTSNVYFDGVDGSALVIALDLKGFAVSSGSACSSGSIEPSHVLLAAGLSEKAARSCVRFSLGREHSFDDINSLADAVIASVHHLRSSHVNKKQARKNEYVPA